MNSKKMVSNGGDEAQEATLRPAWQGRMYEENNGSGNGDWTEDGQGFGDKHGQEGMQVGGQQERVYDLQYGNGNNDWGEDAQGYEEAQDQEVTHGGEHRGWAYNSNDGNDNEDWGRTSKYMRRNKNKETIIMGGTTKDGMEMTTATTIGGRMHKDSGRNKNRGNLTGRNNKGGRMLQATATAMAPPLAMAMTMIITMAQSLDLIVVSSRRSYNLHTTKLVESAQLVAGGCLRVFRRRAFCFGGRNHEMLRVGP